MNSARMALHAVRLLASRGTLTVTELARELEVAPSTAHRVLSNCVAAGSARQEHGGGGRPREDQGVPVAVHDRHDGRAGHLHRGTAHHARGRVPADGRPVRDVAVLVGRVMGMYEVPGETRPGRGFRWVGAVDLERRRTTTHYAGDGSSVGEPLFVPAHEKAGHAEG